MAILSGTTLYVLNDDNEYEAYSNVENEVPLVSNDIYSLCGSEYNMAIKSPLSQKVVRVYTLNEDETLNRDISEYVLDWSLSFTYEQGMTRTGNITLMNYNGEWSPSPVKRTIWKGTKFKIEIGIYHNQIIFWKDCGIFVCGDISMNYEKGTVGVPIYDKFSMLDGTVSGKRASSFNIPVGTTIKAAIELCLNLKRDDIGFTTALSSLPNMSSSNIQTSSSVPSSGTIGYVYYVTSTGTYYYCTARYTFVEIAEGNSYTVSSKTYRFNGNRFIEVSNKVFDEKPIIFPFMYITEVTPYTITTDENCSIGDIIIELADMISCDVFYNTSGNLVLTPGATTNDDLVNKSVLWNYEDNKNQHTKPVYDIKFSELVNQIIVAGSIENGRQYKATVINENPQSQMNIHMTTPSPLYIEDSNLIGDTYCRTRAKYEMIKQGRLGIQMKFDSIYIPHLECNYLVFLTDSKSGIYNEKFVINSIEISSELVMKMSVSSVNEVSF